MKMRAFLVALVLAAVAFAPCVNAQTVQFDLGLGYQWLDVSGNQDLFRTQTNDREGPLLDSLSVLVTDPKGGLFDHMRIEAYGIGASPDSRFRVQAGRAKAFNLRLSYGRSLMFSALPAFANPFLATGVIPGQHTLDRKRDSLDLDLELLPGGAFSPFVGYSRFHTWGAGRTTFQFGQDEFALGSDLDQEINEYRIGATLSLGGWNATVLQGWRNSDNSFDYALLPGAGGGNSSRPVLGVDVVAGQLAGHSHTSTDVPFTNVYVTGRFLDRVRFVGSFANTQRGDTDTDETFTAQGSFASFALSRFFQGASETDHSSNKASDRRGHARIELDITSWLELVAGFTSSRRGLDGEAFLRTTYLNTVNFSGADPRNLATLVSADTAWERTQDVTEVKLNARPTSWLRLWAAGASIDDKVRITPAAAEIVVPGGQGGAFDRSIDRLSAGAEATFGPVMLSADWLNDDADHAIVRADYLDRERFRGRATVTIGSLLKLIGTGERSELENPTPGIEYKATVDHLAAAFDLTPITALTIHGGWDDFKSDSRILYRVPQDFTTATSTYLEDGTSVDGSAALKLGRFMVEAGASRYRNTGDFGFHLDRSFARFDVGITDTVGVYGQWERREYTESLLAAADFKADRFGVFVRLASK